MSSGDRALTSACPQPEQAHGDTQIVARPFQVGEQLPRRLSVGEMCRAFPVDGHPMDRSTFHRHERAGKFERFELRPKVGAKAWSGTLVARYLDCEAGASRFVTVSGSHGRNSAAPRSTVPLHSVKQG
jgi:hypothetical protein